MVASTQTQMALVRVLIVRCRALVAVVSSTHSYIHTLINHSVSFV